MARRSLNSEKGEVREYLHIRVAGSSMFPALRPGDLVTVKREPTPVCEGDILLCVREGRLCAHRVIGFQEGMPVTRGDALNVADGPVRDGELVGRVTGIQRGRRFLVPPRRPPVWERAVAALCRRSDALHRFFMLIWSLGRRIAQCCK